MAGRNPDVGESRDVYLRVRLATFEAEWLDTLRDGDSRSTYVRELIRAEAEAGGLIT